MRRSAALRLLSREHHAPLKVAWRLRHASADEAQEAQDAFVAFMTDEGELHFRAEEDVLLPAVWGLLDLADQRVTRVLDEHDRLRSAALHLRVAPVFDERDVRRLHSLGELLEGHVRHEERVLFPLIEATLTDEELDRLQRTLRRDEARDSASLRAVGSGAPSPAGWVTVRMVQRLGSRHGRRHAC